MTKNNPIFFSFIACLFSVSFFLTVLPLDDLDYDLILGEYMRAPFLAHSFFLLFYFLQLIKPFPQRFDEFKLLNSLPVEPTRVFLGFLIDDFQRFLWLPLAMASIFAGLINWATISFLLRPMFLVMILSVLFFTLQCFVHLFWLNIKWQRRQQGDTLYIAKYNFLIIGTILLLYEFFLPVLIPIAQNSTLFVLVVLTCFGVTLLFGIMAAKLFTVLFKKNYWLRGDSLVKSRITYRKILRWLANGLNPLLVKNMIISSRSKTSKVMFFCLIILMLVAYLFALNNPNEEDAASVLLGFNILYIIIFNFNLVKNRNENWEPIEIIYNLPVSRKQLYLAMFLPGLMHSLLVSGILSLFLYLGGGSLAIIGSFFLKASIAALIFTISSSNHSIGFYPNSDIAQNRFSAWLIALIIAGAVLFPYLNIVLIVFTVYTFLRLGSVRLFRVSV